MSDWSTTRAMPAVAAAGLATLTSVHAAGTDAIRVALVGCGGRGTGAIMDLLEADPNVRIVALADLFPGRSLGCLDTLTKAAKKPAGKAQAGPRADRIAAALQVTPERCFSGFDGYKQAIDSGCDMVILATPPGFRPVHFRYAVEKGKHAFMEKPVATCPTGVRMVLEAGKMAREKGLCVVAGTQRRHQAGYIETIGRIHAGDIGDVVAIQCYWNGEGAKAREAGMDPNWSELEKQCYNWYPYVWLSGDHIVEQHVHNLDVSNWVLSRDGLAHPERCMGVGGRQVHVNRGNIFDYFCIEYEYANGARVISTCRHWTGCPGRVSERVVGTRGTSDPSRSIQSEKPFKYAGPRERPYVQEHADLTAAIRAGKPINEAETVATSTLMGIMGRLAAYTGQDVTWDFVLNRSKLDYVHLALDAKPGPCPPDPVPVPGKTPLA